MKKIASSLIEGKHALNLKANMHRILQIIANSIPMNTIQSQNRKTYISKQHSYRIAEGMHKIKYRMQRATNYWQHFNEAGRKKNKET